MGDAAEGVSFTHAIELLKRDCLRSSASPEQLPPKLSTGPKLPLLFEATADDNKHACSHDGLYREFIAS